MTKNRAPILQAWFGPKFFFERGGTRHAKLGLRGEGKFACAGLVNLVEYLRGGEGFDNLAILYGFHRLHHLCHLHSAGGEGVAGNLGNRGDLDACLMHRRRASPQSVTLNHKTLTA